MNKLRLVHLYLGCFFAPMLIFFAVSGTWQSLPRHYWNNHFFLLLSSIHEGTGLIKGVFHTGQGPAMVSHPSNLSSPLLVCFILLMAASLVLNIILGIIMAFRFGQRAPVLGSLAAGIAIPLLLILFFARG